MYPTPYVGKPKKKGIRGQILPSKAEGPEFLFSSASITSSAKKPNHTFWKASRLLNSGMLFHCRICCHCGILLLLTDLSFFSLLCMPCASTPQQMSLLHVRVPARSIQARYPFSSLSICCCLLSFMKALRFSTRSLSLANSLQEPTTYNNPHRGTTGMRTLHLSIWFTSWVMELKAQWKSGGYIYILS